MFAAYSENAYKEAANLFTTISEYKDAALLEQECHEKAEAARKNSILTSAKYEMQTGTIVSYHTAIGMLESILGWKNADEQIVICKSKIQELEEAAEQERLAREEQERKQAEADRLAEEERARQKAEAERLAREKAEADRIEAEKLAKKKKKIAMIVTPIVCAIIVFIIVLNAVIIPNGKYNDAIALMEAGSIVEAYETLVALDGYKDSTDKADSIYEKYKVEKLKEAKVGDYVFFGSYEQDNNTANGKEDIEWLVLKVKDGRALVISECALDCKQYNTSFTEIAWETCTLRKWLNDDFMNAAFSADEKTMIPMVTVSADKNPKYETNPGNGAQDRVFLLSIAEANEYIGSDSARQCKPTHYAAVNGVYINSDNGNCWWWVRSPGGVQNNAACVGSGGDIFEFGDAVNGSGNAVRPAMWIELDT